MPKLPKRVETDERLAKVQDALARDARPLWEEGTLRVAHVSSNDALVKALLAAKRDRHLLQGLDAAERRLHTEQRGLEVAREKSGGAASDRISRVLLIGDTGSKRFYRDCEALLRRHEARLLGLRFDASFDALAKAALGAEATAKLLFVDDKDAAAEVLLALAG